MIGLMRFFGFLFVSTAVFTTGTNTSSVAQAVIGSDTCPGDMVAARGYAFFPLSVAAYCNRPGKNRGRARYSADRHNTWFCGNRTVPFRLACLEQYGAAYQFKDVCYVRGGSDRKSKRNVWCELKRR